MSNEFSDLVRLTKKLSKTTEVFFLNYALEQKLNSFYDEITDFA